MHQMGIPAAVEAVLRILWLEKRAGGAGFHILTLHRFSTRIAYWSISSKTHISCGSRDAGDGE